MLSQTTTIECIENILISSFRADMVQHYVQQKLVINNLT